MYKFLSWLFPPRPLKDWHDVDIMATAAAERLERNDAYWQQVIDERDNQIVLLQRERDSINSQMEIIYNNMMALAERNIELRAKLGENPVGFLEAIANDDPDLFMSKLVGEGEQLSFPDGMLERIEAAQKEVDNFLKEHNHE